MEYKIEEPKLDDLHEEMAVYNRSINVESISVCSMKQMLQHAMPLEESYRIMKEKMQKDFPNYTI